MTGCLIGRGGQPNRDQYFDLNVQHFHEKLGVKHGIQLSYTWVNRPCREPD